MPTRVYKSTDAGAPTLTGQVGSLIAVLRACLVDGFGSNPPLGWSIPYTDGNNPPLRAHFRQAPKTGWAQYDIEVKDDGSTSMGVDPKFAEAWGWSNATGLGAGSIAFPVRTSAGMITMKSSTADSTPRRWLLVGTDRSFIFVDYHEYIQATSGVEAWFFGDLIPLGPNDVWAVALHGATIDQYQYSLSKAGMADTSSTTSAMPYTFQGAPGPVAFERTWFYGGVSVSDDTVGNGRLPYPNNPDGKGYIERPLVIEYVVERHYRAILPGFWAPYHNWKLNDAIRDWMTFTGYGDLAGRSFIVVKSGTPYFIGSYLVGKSVVAFCIETSDTWYVV
jgi:hypothetical protein